VAELVRIVSGGARRDDVILVMSNGPFGGFIPALLSALRERGDLAVSDPSSAA
jgi:UDP-N-acetylmuramate-alanine ligase